MGAGRFVFGTGHRLCLGKDVVIKDMYKNLFRRYFEYWELLQNYLGCLQIVRRVDMEFVNVGRYIVAGGVAYNRRFYVFTVMSTLRMRASTKCDDVILVWFVRLGPLTCEIAGCWSLFHCSIFCKSSLVTKWRGSIKIVFTYRHTWYYLGVEGVSWPGA